jgi:hypothetical protein
MNLYVEARPANLPQMPGRASFAVAFLGSLGCQTLADPPPNVDGKVVRLLTWDLATPLAQNPGADCNTIGGQGTSTISSGSRFDDLWTLQTIEHSRMRLEVGSEDEELARRTYGAPFATSHGRDVFTVQTHAGRRVRVFVVASDDCSDPFPSDLFDAGVAPAAPNAQ